jgi:hypothetical protein
MTSDVRRSVWQNGGRALWGAAPRHEGHEGEDVAMRRQMIILGLSALSLAGLGRAVRAESSAEVAAVKAAESWLQLVDAGKTAESWDAAAALFKAAMTKEQWQAALGAVRTPLGKLVSRKLKSKQAMTSLPGAPNGQYVVIQYDTVYEHKQEAVETITPMLDPDGQWRVSGYYIR